MTFSDDKLKVLFVCLGNICRSPLAEGVFRHLVEQAGLADRIEIDSAGTSSYHIGDPPDQRATTVARGRGIALTGASRQLIKRDLEWFDYVIVMDADNYEAAQHLAGGKRSSVHVHLLREFDAEAAGDLDVPDPYYGGARGFEKVHDIVDRSCRALLAHIRATHAF